jgi:hypothetical protein
MDDDVKSRFDEVERRHASLEKRIDDVKWYVTGVATVFGVIFGLVSLVMNWRFEDEKTTLRQFQTQIREDIGKGEPPPRLELLALNRALLSGQDIKVDVVPGDKFARINFSHFISNKGDGATGPLWVKLYTNDPLRMSNASVDEAKFKYDGFISPGGLAPSELPGKFEMQFYLSFELAGPDNPPAGRYPALLKYYYGKGRVTEAPITLVIGEAGKR